MGRLDGKVAFITGAGRGQGRSHAVRLAQEGADIIAIDIAEEIPTIKGFSPPPTEAELAETVSMVEAQDRRIVSAKVDVRDYQGMKKALDDGVAELGRVDILAANAAIFRHTGMLHEVDEDVWDDIIDVNLKGVWHSIKAVVPRLIEQGDGGSIILTSSTAGIKGTPNIGPYVASKHGVVGLMRTLANELAPWMIRVNSVHPTAVNTPMIQNQATYNLFAPDKHEPTQEEVIDRFRAGNALPIPWVEPVDISNAVLFLASDEARYVTGTELKVDAGLTVK